MADEEKKKDNKIALGFVEGALYGTVFGLLLLVVGGLAFAQGFTTVGGAVFAAVGFAAGLVTGVLKNVQ